MCVFTSTTTVRPLSIFHYDCMITQMLQVDKLFDVCFVLHCKRLVFLLTTLPSLKYEGIYKSVNLSGQTNQGAEGWIIWARKRCLEQYTRKEFFSRRGKYLLLFFINLIKNIYIYIYIYIIYVYHF